MPTEIERKFLVKTDCWTPEVAGRRMAQGYLSQDPDRTVRVRVVGNEAFMTVKSRRTGISRTEIEFPIPLEQAQDLLALCHRPLIDKTRYEIMHAGMLWEVDVFHAENTGLVVAEIELPHEEHAFELPPWVGAEVSADMRYTNSRLSALPYTQWPEVISLAATPGGPELG